MTLDLDIVMPYYGDVTLMKRAVSSVLAQTEQAWRLTVLDDCYPDDEPHRFFTDLKDGRVRYVRHPVNVGAARNFQIAWSLVTGSHVVFMGADDIMMPTYVEAMTAAATSHPAAAVFHPGVEVIDEEGRRVRPLADRVKSRLRPSVTERYRVLAGEDACATLLHGNWTYFPSMMWNVQQARRRAATRGFHVVHDLELLVDVLAAGGELVLTRDLAFQYRRHSGSMSSTTALDGRRFEEERDFFAAVGPTMSAAGWGRAERAARWHIMSRMNAAATGARLAAGGRPRAAFGLWRSHTLARPGRTTRGRLSDAG